MSNKSPVLPNGWGNDLLSNFQNIAFENELATFVHAPQWQQALLDVATVLNKCAQYAIEQVLKLEDPSAILLFLTANNQFLASARSVSAEHCLAAYPTGRATVESALYGWYLSNNIEAAQRWNNKPTKKDELKSWGNEFRFSSLTKLLSTIDTGLAEWAKYLHQFAIDFGAHPNKDALYSNMEHEHGKDGSLTIKMVILHPWNQFSISTMKFTIETGMIVIRLFAIGLPDGLQTLNLANDIDRLVSNLVHLQNTTKFESDN
ncbi:MAG: hypothetical protein WCA64_03275 [Gallionella sp.]